MDVGFKAGKCCSYCHGSISGTNCEMVDEGCYYACMNGATGLSDRSGNSVGPDEIPDGLEAP